MFSFGASLGSSVSKVQCHERALYFKSTLFFLPFCGRVLYGATNKGSGKSLFTILKMFHGAFFFVLLVCCEGRASMQIIVPLPPGTPPFFSQS